MDNLTHTLTGLCLSRAGFNRVTPLATPLLLIAANLPDADVVSLAGGSVSYLHWHRNITHSLIAAPFLALGLAFAFRLYRRTLLFTPLFLAALAGVASHLLLDLTNIYGVRLLEPFRKTWFEWDLTPVIDFWIWGIFAAAVAGPFLSRLVGSEIGERRKGAEGRGFAIAALLAVVVYNGGRAAAHSRVLGVLETREYAGAAPIRLAAFPASMNPFNWLGVAETDAGYRLFDFAPPYAIRPDSARVVEKAAPSPAIDAAAKTLPFQVMSEFAQYPVYRMVPQGEGGTDVELSDIRFGFTSTAFVNRAGQVEKSQFQFGSAAPK